MENVCGHKSLRFLTTQKLHKNSVTQLKQTYLEILKESGNTTEIFDDNTGRPLKPGDLYGQVQIYFRSINVGLYRYSDS